MRRVMSVCAAALMLLVTGPGFADDGKKAPDDVGHSNPGKGINFYSLEKEIALGKQLAQEVERQAKILEDPIIAEFVNRLGQNLARNSDTNVPFTVKVIDSNEVNAFALPGGFMFVNTGLISKAESEAELAGVLSHEIAHVAARHGTKQASRGHIINFASIPLIFLGGWPGYAVRQAAGLAVPLGFLKFTRGMERQADGLGLEYMYRSGYDPTAFLDFFERIQSLEKRKAGTLAKVFSSHPPTGDRIKQAQKIIQKELEPQPQYIVDTSVFQDVRKRLAMFENRRGDPRDENRPTLRRRTGRHSDDERPTLKRRE
jgi:beta-barrel assembly-enhancing protease